MKLKVYSEFFFLSSGGKKKDFSYNLVLIMIVLGVSFFLMLYFVVVIFKGFVIIFRFPEIILPLTFGVRRVTYFNGIESKVGISKEISE